MAAARTFVLLAPAALIGSFNVATGWVYLSLGHTGRQFRWGLFASALTVAGFAVGLPWGIDGVAAAFSVVTVGLRYPSIAYCFRGTPLAPGDLVRVVWRPAAASAVAGVAVWAARGPLAGLAPWAALLVAAAGFAVAYAATWLALPAGWQTIREMAALVKELKPRTKPSPDRPAAAAGSVTRAAAPAAALIP